MNPPPFAIELVITILGGIGWGVLGGAMAIAYATRQRDLRIGEQLYAEAAIRKAEDVDRPSGDATAT